MRLQLTKNELVNVRCACHAIEIDECTPNYLQDFIVARLLPEWPTLAAKVRHLEPEQMHLLCHYLKNAQSPTS